MKRHFALISLMIAFAAVLTGCNLNRLGTDQYYVQIAGDGKEEISKADDGKEYRIFNYQLAGFDEEGKEKTMTFTADKNLKKGAFLRVYDSKKKGVTSWEEVDKEDIPDLANERLDVKK
ncbi:MULTISPECIES: YxeA family protein [unclassified Bacillus (in: firmicutes)]|uniref:YxeA family protein n=1 Tax=unclassified Bacillus (in: firmicutes) TaxID=185979 RepID=UPI0003F7C884|nr:YxeA family protein [Bacillus sp. NSP9.1]QHZ47044.1 YxeA family protein [Bacillus sp. NSP9.1]